MELLLAVAVLTVGAMTVALVARRTAPPDDAGMHRVIERAVRDGGHHLPDAGGWGLAGDWVELRAESVLDPGDDPDGSWLLDDLALREELDVDR